MRAYRLFAIAGVGLWVFVAACLLPRDSLHAGLVSHWTFDSDFTDSAGSNHGVGTHGVDTVSSVPSKVGGGALRLEGAWEQVGMEENYPDLQFVGASAITLTGWTYLEANPATFNAGVVSKLHPGSGAYGLGIRPSGSVFGGVQTSGGWGASPDDGDLVPVAEWAHIAMTYDGSEVVRYLNGAPTGAAHTPPGGNIVGTGTPLAIGALAKDRIDWSSPFVGSIDDVSVWNVTLTPGEMKSLFDVANSAELAYDTGRFNRLKGAHDNTATTTIGNRVWTYAENLTTPAGLSGSGDGSTLVMDPTAGTGLVASGGLISHWKFDSDFTDSAGSNDGAPVGSAAVSTVQSKLGGGSVHLDGSSYVNMDNPSSLQITGDQLTLSAWVRHAADQGDVGVVGKLGGFGDDAYGLGLRGNDTVFAGIRNSGGTWAPTSYPGDGSTAPLDEWIHIAMVYDGSNITRYLNGVATGTLRTQTGDINNAATGLAIGNHGDGRDLFFNGYIDDASVWGVALADGEMKGLFDVANSPELAYDTGMFNQLKDAHDTMGTTNIGHLEWSYTDGLGSTPGLSGSGGRFTLVLDPVAGTGLMSVPEPAAAMLLLVGLPGLLALHRRRKGK